MSLTFLQLCTQPSIKVDGDNTKEQRLEDICGHDLHSPHLSRRFQHGETLLAFHSPQLGRKQYKTDLALSLSASNTPQLSPLGSPTAARSFSCLYQSRKDSGSHDDLTGMFLHPERAKSHQDLKSVRLRPRHRQMQTTDEKPLARKQTVLSTERIEKIQEVVESRVIVIKRAPVKEMAATDKLEVGVCPTTANTYTTCTSTVSTTGKAMESLPASCETTVMHTLPRDGSHEVHTCTDSVSSNADDTDVTIKTRTQASDDVFQSVKQKESKSKLFASNTYEMGANNARDVQSIDVSQDDDPKAIGNIACDSDNIGRKGSSGIVVKEDNSVQSDESITRHAHINIPGHDSILSVPRRRVRHRRRRHRGRDHHLSSSEEDQSHSDVLSSSSDIELSDIGKHIADNESVVVKGHQDPDPEHIDLKSKQAFVPSTEVVSALRDLATTIKPIDVLFAGSGTDNVEDATELDQEVADLEGSESDFVSCYSLILEDNMKSPLSGSDIDSLVFANDDLSISPARLETVLSVDENTSSDDQSTKHLSSEYWQNCLHTRQSPVNDVTPVNQAIDTLLDEACSITVAKDTNTDVDSSEHNSCEFWQSGPPCVHFPTINTDLTPTSDNPDTLYTGDNQNDNHTRLSLSCDDQSQEQQSSQFWQSGPPCVHFPISSSDLTNQCDRTQISLPDNDHDGDDGFTDSAVALPDIHDNNDNIVFVEEYDIVNETMTIEEILPSEPLETDVQSSDIQDLTADTTNVTDESTSQRQLVPCMEDQDVAVVPSSENVSQSLLHDICPKSDLAETSELDTYSVNIVSRPDDIMSDATGGHESHTVTDVTMSPGETSTADIITDATGGYESLTDITMSPGESSTADIITDATGGYESLTDITLSAGETSTADIITDASKSGGYESKILTDITMSPGETSTTNIITDATGGYESLTDGTMSPGETSTADIITDATGECESRTDITLSAGETSTADIITDATGECESLTDITLSAGETSTTDIITDATGRYESLTDITLSAGETSTADIITAAFKSVGYESKILTDIKMSPGETSTANIITDATGEYESKTLTDITMSPGETSTADIITDATGRYESLTDGTMSPGETSTADIITDATGEYESKTLTDITMSPGETSTADIITDATGGYESLTDGTMSPGETSTADIITDASKSGGYESEILTDIKMSPGETSTADIITDATGEYESKTLTDITMSPGETSTADIITDATGGYESLTDGTMSPGETSTADIITDATGRYESLTDGTMSPGETSTADIITDATGRYESKTLTDITMSPGETSTADIITDATGGYESLTDGTMSPGETSTADIITDASKSGGYESEILTDIKMSPGETSTADIITDATGEYESKTLTDITMSPGETSTADIITDATGGYESQTDITMSPGETSTADIITDATGECESQTDITMSAGETCTADIITDATGGYESQTDITMSPGETSTADIITDATRGYESQTDITMSPGETSIADIITDATGEYESKTDITMSPGETSTADIITDATGGYESQTDITMSPGETSTADIITDATRGYESQTDITMSPGETSTADIITDATRGYESQTDITMSPGETSIADIITDATGGYESQTDITMSPGETSIADIITDATRGYESLTVITMSPGETSTADIITDTTGGNESKTDITISPGESSTDEMAHTVSEVILADNKVNFHLIELGM